MQNRQVSFCFWTKGNKWCQSVFCIHFLDLKNKQKSAKIIKAMCTTQKQAHIIFPQIKHLPSNKHPPPSKHPPTRPRPIQISTPPVSPAITLLNGRDTKEECDNLCIIDEDDENQYIFYKHTWRYMGVSVMRLWYTWLPTTVLINKTFHHKYLT